MPFWLIGLLAFALYIGAAFLNINIENIFNMKGVFMNLKPLGDRVVVKAAVAEEKTLGGIILPDTAKEKPHQGEVVAVGVGKINSDGKRLPMELKVGDKVLYGKYSGTEITYEGSEYLIMTENDIMAIL